MDDEIILSRTEEGYYNTYLKTLRQSQDKPFRYRQDFSNLEKDIKFTLRKLTLFFKDYPTIAVDDFFKAPFVVYDSNDYVKIHFYTTRRAIKAYTQFQTVLNTVDPDTKFILTKFAESLQFVMEFCIDNQIKLDEYLAFKSSGSKIEDFLSHLKHKKISFYTICALTKSGGSIRSNMTDLIYPNFYEMLSLSRGKFMTSKVMKVVADNGIKKINKKIN